MTVFTYLALALSYLSSTGLSTLGTIVASASWVVGSFIIPGNIFLLPDANTTTTNKVFIGAQEAFQIATGGISFSTNGTQTGVVVKDNGNTAFGSFTINCIGTGGNVKVNNEAKYDTCFGRLPLTSTGVITAVSMEFAATPVAVGIDCGLVTAANNGTGTVLLNNVQATTGSTLFVDQAEFSGSLLPPGKVASSQQYFKCGTLGTPTSTFSAKARLFYYDTTAD
jgi:hypothetical protein